MTPILLTQEMGVRLHDWHDGQFDPIYALGSCAFAQVAVELDLIKTVINKLESMRDSLKHRVDVNKELNKWDKVTQQDAENYVSLCQLVCDLRHEVNQVAKLD